MADGADDPSVHWVEPRLRAILPLDSFHLSRSLAKLIRQQRFTVSFDRDFAAVIQACAEPRAYADGTWITESMQSAYLHLHHQGIAHSVCDDFDQSSSMPFSMVLGVPQNDSRRISLFDRTSRISG